MDECRRGFDDGGGDADGREGQFDADRSAWRRNEGIGAGGPLLCTLKGGTARCGESFLREVRHSPAPARGFYSQGWTFGRDNDGNGSDFGVDETGGEARCCDDGRNYAARTGATGWRREGESISGPPRRH